MAKRRLRLKPEEAEYLDIKPKEAKGNINPRYHLDESEYNLLNQYRNEKLYTVTGRSTLRDADGNIKIEWTKTSLDKEKQLESLKEALNGLREDIKPADKIVRYNLPIESDLCTQYTLTDFHLGMMAWGEESGADWDLKLAEDLLVNWFKAIIQQTPNSKKAVFAQIGDFLHWDGLEAVTPTSKNILDADTRFTKLVRVAIKSIRRIIKMLLEKHEEVHIIMAEGNHDLAGSIWLRETLQMFYEDEPRVKIDTNPDPYYGFTWGDILLAYHHGHKKNLSNIETVILYKFREEYGRTKYVYTHTGHRHHAHLKETNTMKIEQHPTLSPKDAHSSRGGYSSKREASAITYHKKYGEVSRTTVKPEML